MGTNDSEPTQIETPSSSQEYNKDQLHNILNSQLTRIPAYTALAGIVLLVLATLVRILGLLNSSTPQPLAELCYYASYGGYVLFPVVIATTLAATGLLALLFRKHRSLSNITALTVSKLLMLAIISYYVLPILFGFSTWFFHGENPDNCWYDRANHLENLKDRERFKN